MIWATASSWSCFCWLYRASSSLASKNNQSDFGIDHLVMAMCRVFSCVVGRGCLLWSVGFLGKTLLACVLLHIVLQGQTYLLLCVSLDFFFCIPVTYDEKGYLLWVWVLEGLVDLHRTIRLQLLQHYWLGHRLGLLWYWMACLGNKQQSFGHFWDCTEELQFGLLLTMRASPFLLRDSCPQW